MFQLGNLTVPKPHQGQSLNQRRVRGAINLKNRCRKTTQTVNVAIAAAVSNLNYYKTAWKTIVQKVAKLTPYITNNGNAKPATVE